MRATKLKVGDLIDYRGYQARVTRVWTTSEDATGGFFETIGIEFEWTDADGNLQKTRQVWPEMNAEERRAARVEMRSGGKARIEALAQQHCTVKPWGA